MQIERRWTEKLYLGKSPRVKEVERGDHYHRLDVYMVKIS